MDDLYLGQALFGKRSPNKNTGKSPNSTSTVQAIAVSKSVNGRVDVLLDNQLITVSTTFAIEPDDICMISITNGTPVVTGIIGKGDKVDGTIDGTIRATSAVIMSIVAGSVDAETITASEAFIKELQVEDFDAENIEATAAKFVNLYSKDAKFDSLTATTATIETLKSTKAYIDTLISKDITTDKLTAATGFIGSLTSNDITASKITAAAGYIDMLKSNDVTTEKLIAVNAVMDTLSVNDVTAENLVAANVYFKALEGAYADVDDLKADLANIKTLNVNELAAKLAVIDTLETTYAKIDLTNIQEACIKEAYIEDGAIGSAKIKEGAIHEVNIADAEITAAKIKSINADTITTGTIKTERLLLVDNETGEVSIIKALNVANGVGTDVASGTKIQAESIDVIDLWALNATIGGFTISENSIYNAKESIDDPNSGVYIGLDGVGIGNGNVLGLEDKSPFMVKSDGTFYLGGEDNNLYFDPFTGELSLNVSNLSIEANDILGMYTSLVQTTESLQINFGQLAQDQEVLDYIRFQDGAIILGSINSPTLLRIENESIKFMQNNTEVAHIEDDNLYTTRVKVTDQLEVNNWKWKQRANGNISFRWIEG